MPKINKVAHVVLAVSDVERSKTFYRDVLGMELVSDRPDQGPSAFLSFGKQHHDVALFQAPPGAKRGELGLIHFALQLDGGIDELREMRQWMLDCGAELTNGPLTHGITNSLYFHDPDGHTFEIYSEVFATGQEGIEYMRSQAGYGVTEPITL
jgi:catechol 2,3-dioxygenase-like lactoylglutathione lyase family enzyme